MQIYAAKLATNRFLNCESVSIGGEGEGVSRHLCIRIIYYWLSVSEYLYCPPLLTSMLQLLSAYKEDTDAPRPATAADCNRVLV